MSDDTRSVNPNQHTRMSGKPVGVCRSGLKSAAQVLRALKEDRYDWMQAERGHRVLGLGCGPGTDTLALAERVGSDGMMVGREARLRDPDHALQRSLWRQAAS